VLLDLLTLAVLAWVGWRLFQAARGSFQSGWRAWRRELVGGLRPRHFLLAIPTIALVLVAAVVLLQVPGLDIGWWTAIGGVGNPVVGGTERTTGTALEWLVPAVFLGLLVFALPLLVTREEEMFRMGAESWTPWRRARRSVEFGLAHALIGIPVGVALALSVGGGYFTWAYLRGVRRSGGSQRAGVLESARSHLAYNVTILAVVALGLVASACGGSGGSDTSGPKSLPSANREITVASSAFRDVGTIPRQYTCDGAGGPPPLTWRGVPSDAAAVYLVVADPDAPGGTFVHWILGPLPSSSTGVTASTPTDGWRPPCPPKGSRPHRYRFVVYATSSRVAVDRGAATETIDAIGRAATASGTLVGTYSR
jgi:phosphatidylethanolamine-binding protein (PEBP) family uncharacterized protein